MKVIINNILPPKGFKCINLFGSGTGAKVLGGDGRYHTEIRQIIPKDARPLVTYPTRFGG